jgi:hypothetical protein
MGSACWECVLGNGTTPEVRTGRSCSGGALAEARCREGGPGERVPGEGVALQKQFTPYG